MQTISRVAGTASLPLTFSCLSREETDVNRRAGKPPTTRPSTQTGKFIKMGLEPPLPPSAFRHTGDTPMDINTLSKEAPNDGGSEASAKTVHFSDK
mmetsp:Transcript_32579/g.65977  ORF Transcript_32579/g.65977 Transcript_32579/m.65977 type:complete len:96 (+) Transcript_32579:2028-2315(+)